MAALAILFYLWRNGTLSALIHHKTPTITNRPSPGTDVTPNQHCDIFTIGGTLPPEFTGFRYAVQGFKDQICCPQSQVFDDPANGKVCCAVKPVEANGVKFCPQVGLLEDGRPVYPHTPAFANSKTSNLPPATITSASAPGQTRAVFAKISM